MRDYDPQTAVDFLIDNSKEYAEAESNKVYMEEMRKTIKAECMKEAEDIGHKTAAIQEREAYRSEKYKAHLGALKEAVRMREEARWMMIAAQERINVWRSQEASNRRIEGATL
jgi:trehalose utilization protein